MEIQTEARPPSGSAGSSPAAAYPRWVILEHDCKADDSFCPTAVDKTLAAARTSHGHPIQVSLSLQDPPATSAVRVKLVGGSYDCMTMAAHGGSLLIQAVNYVIIEPDDGADAYTVPATPDYFVYDVGDAAADPPRPPSLFLLPQYHPSESEDSRRPSDPVSRWLLPNCTGILRHPGRGADDDEVVVVVELQMATVISKDDYAAKEEAELLLFSSGEWSVKRPRIWYHDDLPEQEMFGMAASVFPVGDTTLCWADEHGGVLFYDVMEENPSPRLRYVPPPTELIPADHLPSPCFGRRVCATAAGGVRLVNIFPRCCCGVVGTSDCERSHHAYTINTWTLRIDNGAGMEWVMDGTVDATDLWPMLEGLPRVPPGFPFVSMYEPHVICFSLREIDHVHGLFADMRATTTLWLVMVDVRSKRVLSVSRHPHWFSGRDAVTSNVSYYLNNPHQTCTTSTTGQSAMSIEVEKRQDNNVTNLMLQPLCESAAEPDAQASSDEILAAIREIPSYGLANDDMLKAFLILSGDNNGCRVRSFLRVPKNLRKDWLLVEIKANDAN